MENNMYGQPQKEEKYGLAVASLVVGILSMTLCCIGGSIVGLAGLILGIISCTKKESKRGLAIGGMITSAIGFLIGVVYIGIIIWAITDYEDYDDFEHMQSTITGEESLIPDDYEIAANVFDGHSYQAGDGSVIYFEDDSFIWYKDDSDHENNYYTGTYDAYFAEEARNYILYDLSAFGVTEEELDDYFDRNEDDDFFTEENFCCLVLHNESLIMDGEEQITEAYDSPYMGFYADGYYDAANMRSGEYYSFTIVE